MSTAGGLSEDDISVKFITPALHKAGWDEDTQIRRQVGFTKGRIIVGGRPCIAEIGFISPRVFADDDVLASFVPMPLIAAEVGVEHQHEQKVGTDQEGIYALR